MTREEFLKERILQIDSIRGFAASIDMPYTTLLSILKNVGGASIDNIFIKLYKPSILLTYLHTQLLKVEQPLKIFKHFNSLYLPYFLIYMEVSEF